MLSRQRTLGRGSLSLAALFLARHVFALEPETLDVTEAINDLKRTTSQSHLENHSIAISRMSGTQNRGLSAGNIPIDESLRRLIGPDWSISLEAANGDLGRFLALHSETDPSRLAIAFAERGSDQWRLDWLVPLESSPGKRSDFTALQALPTSPRKPAQLFASWVVESPREDGLHLAAWGTTPAGPSRTFDLTLPGETSGASIRANELFVWNPVPTPGVQGVYEPILDDVVSHENPYTYRYYRLRTFARQGAAWIQTGDRISTKVYLPGEVAKLDPFEAAQDSPFLHDEPGSRSVDLLASAAREYANADLGSAVTALRAVVAAEPTWPEAWFALAHAALRQGDRSEAVRAFREALYLDPAQSTLRLQLANLFEESGDPFAAELELRKSLGGDPQNGACLCALAELYDSQGENIFAVACYRKLLGAGRPSDSESEQADMGTEACVTENGYPGSAETVSSLRRTLTNASNR